MARLRGSAAHSLHTVAQPFLSCICLMPSMLCRTAVDSYMKARDPAGPFLAGLRSRIALSQQESIMQGTRYNVPLLNALVFYVGIEVGQQLSDMRLHCFARLMCAAAAICNKYVALPWFDCAARHQGWSRAHLHLCL